MLSRKTYLRAALNMLRAALRPGRTAAGYTIEGYGPAVRLQAVWIAGYCLKRAFLGIGSSHAP